MERLTARNELGEAYYKKCLKLCFNLTGEDCRTCSYRNAACERLAAYEDLDITPEQVRELDRICTEKIQELTKYQKLEEDGLLLRLPCKAGDTVYCWRKVVPTEYHNYSVHKWLKTDNEIIPARVVNIKVLKKGTTIKVALKGKCFIQGMHDGEMETSEDFEYCTYNISIGAIGKTVFLTQAEAEQALAEMKGV